ncbi:hypothetical protein LXA43DRAFT_1099202 [Ganoderma leucocontextum]|nr:hypothetical protein LXA43DRAFT_1067295 [Ganoderma leucocontextum]KAI1786490.1 hypothetical protein LXA43DRAFT_1099202 [Ganoderma leucocontextum]
MSDPSPNKPRPHFAQELCLFVEKILCPSYPYTFEAAEDIIDEFYIRLCGLPLFVSCDDINDYFRATYQFLSEKPAEDRVGPGILLDFFQQYSRISRQRAFEHTCEELRKAEEEHRQLYDQFWKALLSCVRADTTAGDAEYNHAAALHDASIDTLRDCADACREAAAYLTVYRACGVYHDIRKYGDTPFAAKAEDSD